MATVAETLEMAADLLAAPGAWTQGTWARDHSGKAVTLRSDQARCFCMRGALVLAAGVSMTAEMSRIQKALGFPNAGAMSRWNDKENRTQAEVVSALRAAAAKAREVRS